MFKKKQIYLLILILLVGADTFATSFRRDCFAVFSAGGTDRARQDTIIAEKGILGFSGTSADYNIIRDIHPEFKWLLYISVEDTYVKGIDVGEHNYVVSRAQQDGLDPEINYLHYYDDTQISLQGQTIFVPGWGGGSAATKEEARIPVYYADKSRIMKNHSDPNSRKYHVEYAVNRLNELPSGSNVGYYSGIFWDNSAYRLWNYGTISSGGHVLEDPANGHIDDIGDYDYSWYWQQLRSFHVDFMDTLATSESWSADGKQKISALNIISAWTDDYVDYNVAHILSKEFLYSPIRNYTQTLIESHRQDSLAFLNGQAISYISLPTTSISGYSGSYTYGEALLGNLCWFYITSTDSSYFHNLGASAPGQPSWDTLVWCGAMDYDVGYPMESHYQTAQTGTDGKGYNYTIFSREYQNAKIFLRPRGRYNQDIDAATAVSLDLGGWYKEVYADSSLGSSVSSISFRNGEGHIMVPASQGIDSIPPAPTDDLGANPGDTPGTVDLAWHATGDDGHYGRATSLEIAYSTIPFGAANWDQNDFYTPAPTPTFSGQLQTVTVDGLTPGRMHYFRIQTFDEALNPSGVSNMDSAQAAVGFVSGDDDPVPLTVVSPRDRSTIQTRAPTLVITNADSLISNVYYFQVADDLDFGFLLANSEAVPQGPGTTTSWTVPELLPPGGPYYWHIRVNDEPFGAVWQFSIKPPARVFPNPFRADGSARATFTGISPDATLIITTVSGSVVRSWPNTTGEDILWDGSNQSGELVATGIYLWYVVGTPDKGKLAVKR